MKKKTKSIDTNNKNNCTYTQNRPRRQCKQKQNNKKTKQINSTWETPLTHIKKKKKQNTI